MPPQAHVALCFVIFLCGCEMMNVPGAHDREMFEFLADRAIGAISVVYEQTVDAAMLFKCAAGFQHCAVIAQHFRMTNVLNHLVISLCKYLDKAIAIAMEHSASTRREEEGADGGEAKGWRVAATRQRGSTQQVVTQYYNQSKHQQSFHCPCSAPH